MAHCLKITKVKKAATALLLAICVLGTCACSNGEDTKDKVFLTTGFSENELFIIKDVANSIQINCDLPEALIYLANTKDKYEDVYGPGIWDTSVNNVTMTDSIKDNVIFELSQVKAMNILATLNGITLTEEEMAQVEKCVNDYYSSLSSHETDVLMATPELVSRMYTEYALAEKLYESLIADINPEISDDEARTITVQHIFIRTYTTGEHGEKIDYSESAKEIAYRKAAMIRELALDGEHDFKDLVLQYSDGDLSDYSFCKGDTEPEFEQAAFDLGNDEISEVIETRWGYHIIKCISTFNREETDNNKLKLSEVLRREVFGKEYDEFADTLTTYFNDGLWENVDLFRDSEINTQSFFEIYHTEFD